jgi:hypothetical protein
MVRQNREAQRRGHCSLSQRGRNPSPSRPIYRNSCGAPGPASALHTAALEAGELPSGIASTGTLRSGLIPTLLMSVPAGVWYLRA